MLQLWQVLLTLPELSKGQAAGSIVQRYDTKVQWAHSMSASL